MRLLLVMSLKTWLSALRIFENIFARSKTFCSVRSSRSRYGTTGCTAETLEFRNGSQKSDLLIVQIRNCNLLRGARRRVYKIISVCLEEFDSRVCECSGLMQLFFFVFTANLESNWILQSFVKFGSDSFRISHTISSEILMRKTHSLEKI